MINNQFRYTNTCPHIQQFNQIHYLAMQQKQLLPNYERRIIKPEILADSIKDNKTVMTNLGYDLETDEKIDQAIVSVLAAITYALPNVEAIITSRDVVSSQPKTYAVTVQIDRIPRYGEQPKPNELTKLPMVTHWYIKANGDPLFTEAFVYEIKSF